MEFFNQTKSVANEVLYSEGCGVGGEGGGERMQQYMGKSQNQASCAYKFTGRFWSSWVDIPLFFFFFKVLLEV